MASRAMASQSSLGDTVHIKVGWLKQRVGEGSRPLLEFDDLKDCEFDGGATTFRTVKHTCSYPAPPHKVRMWCSSLGASTNLPATMDLNAFINTFELITEERHTLTMGQLTGGETIALEMLQSDQVSELSGFLLGGAKGAVPPGALVGKTPLGKGAVLTGLDATAAATAEKQVRLSLEEQAQLAREMEAQAAEAEKERRKLADELIAEEEEEARRREKKKAKKRGKKGKAKERKKAAASRGDGDDDDDDDDAPPTTPGCAEKVGGDGADALPAPRGAASVSAARGPVPDERGGGAGSGSSCNGESAIAAGGASDEADDEGWEAAAVDGEAAGNALSDAELVAHLRAQLQRGQAVMRALVMECLAEREAKQELEFQLTQLRARVE